MLECNNSNGSIVSDVAIFSTLVKQENVLSRNVLSNKVFLSRNYRLIVALRKFDVHKTNICLRSEAWQEQICLF